MKREYGVFLFLFFSFYHLNCIYQLIPCFLFVKALEAFTVGCWKVSIVFTRERESGWGPSLCVSVCAFALPELFAYASYFIFPLSCVRCYGHHLFSLMSHHYLLTFSLVFSSGGQGMPFTFKYFSLFIWSEFHASVI
ncbi:hypothetical protein F4810DRAFT_650989 [Camillea tinctor]|nr:hypothetical protein F4810DRAFT_650989 [Camillea tinctor]